MNSFTSISFVFLFLLQGLAPNMDLCCELQKLPNLFKHYEEHKEYDGDSFWQFLVEDYLNDDGDSQEHHDDFDHNNLPFHGNHQCCHASVFYSPVQYFSLLEVDYVSPSKPSYYSSSFSSQFPDSLFQPPKA